MMKIASALVLLACLAPVGCVVTSGPPVAGAPSPVFYYYGGTHFYPTSFGGDWCAVDQPHAHDFPPDHPECYARELDYYYFTGCNGQTHVAGRVPAGVNVHVAKPRAPHEPAAVPHGAPVAPHIATGRIPTRSTHPAPAQPTPPATPVSSPTNPAIGRPQTVPVRPAPAPVARPEPARPKPPRPEPVRPDAVRPAPARLPSPTRADPTQPTAPTPPPPTPPTPPADTRPKKVPDARDPKDDNATRPKRSPDARDPKDDNATTPAPDAPLRYTPPAKRKDPVRVAPAAPK